MSWECGGVDMIIVSLWSSTSSFSFSHVCGKFRFRLLGFLCQLPRMKVSLRCQRHSQKKRVKQHEKTRESNFANFLCHFFFAAVAIVLTVQHFFLYAERKERAANCEIFEPEQTVLTMKLEKVDNNVLSIVFHILTNRLFCADFGKTFKSWRRRGAGVEKWKTTILPHHK